MSKHFEDRQIRPEMYTFDEELNCWREKIPPMIKAQCFHGVISLKSTLVVAGGQISSPTAESDGYTDSVEIFKHDQRMWYQTKPLPIPLFNMSTAHHHDTCYVVGGFRDKELCQAFYADFGDLLHFAESANQTNVWKSLPNTPSAQPSVTIMAGRLFAIGGSSGDQKGEAQKLVCTYSSSSNLWELICDLPEERLLATLSSISLSPVEVLVIGGRIQLQDNDLSNVYIGSLQH